METGTKSEAYQAAEAALVQATGAALHSAAAQTGEPELDGLTGIAGKSSHNLDAVMKRWGMQGVNYIGNLLKAGRGDLAASIAAMPTYAKSAILAETSMRTFGLNDDAIAAQENALKADMQSPIVVLSAKQIAKRQAVDARKAELTAGAAPVIPSALKQRVNDAGRTVQQSKAALDQAVRNEQALRNALYNAQDAFHKDMADSDAADVLAAAIGQLQKAAALREKAQKAFTQNQQTLSDAQRKLTDAQKQAETEVEEQAKLDVDVLVKNLAATKTELLGMAGGQAGEQANGLPGGAQRLKTNDAVPNSSLSPDGKFQQTISNLRNGQPPLQSVDLDTDRLSLLANKNGSGIIKEGSQQLESGTAAVSQYKENRPSWALASSGAATDVGYTNGIQNAQATEDGDTAKGPGFNDLLNVVLTPKQFGGLAGIDDDVRKLLTDVQRQRLNAGENIDVIISELDSIKQAQIDQLSQNVLKKLDPQQKRDLLFLGSGLFAGIDLKTRQAVLQHLKENGGKITYDDLVDLGVYEPGALADGGFKRWLQDNDMGGGPAHFADLLAEEYALSDFETSFAKLDQEQRNQRGAEMTMLLAMIAAPLIDTAVYGRALSPNDRYNPNSRLDNIEQEGWSIKGPQSFIDPPEVARRPDGTPEAAGEIKLYRVMSDVEYKSIIDNGGKFSKYDNAMEEKWFATTPEDAAKWADMFYPDGQYRLIEITVPTDSLKKMYQVNRLDGIGPAYCGGIDYLNINMKGLTLK